MKKYKQIFIVFTLGIFIVPQIAFASWWNPISWFKKNIDETPKIETIIVETPTNTRAPTSIKSTPQSIAPQVIRDTKIVEKPVIQTITVQDPALQKQITDLIADNALLKLKIEELTKKIETRENELQSLKSVPVFSKVEECKNAQGIVNAFTGKYKVIESQLKKEYDSFHDKNVSEFGFVNQKDLDLIKNKYKKEMSALAKEMSLAKSKTELYCE